MIAPDQTAPRTVADTGDERMRMDARTSLAQWLSAKATLVDIDVQDGDVTLRGRFHRYYDKALAGEAIKRVDGVRRISNRIVVIPK